MNKIFWRGVRALFLLAGCAACETWNKRRRNTGRPPPVIEQSFAPKAMEKGDTWKIYLKASDPDGDMKTILAYFERGAIVGTTAVSSTQIKENDRWEMSGYLYWYPGLALDVFQEVVMIIQVQDMAGHFSNPVSLPLRIQPSGSQESPPEGAFQEKELGPVMITVQPAGASAGSK